MALLLIFSIRSSSTQPPETEPTTWPSSRIATMAPTGRGAEPQVLTMVPSATRRPCLRHASAVRRTSISTLSMGKCYRNSAAVAAHAVADFERRAVAGRDLAHDGEAQPAAGARGAGHAVEAFQNALALLGRDARAVILDFHERPPVARPGAHGNVAAARRVFDRVVDQVAERLAQEERVSADARRREFEAEVELARERAVPPFVGRALRQTLRVRRRTRLDMPTALGARQGKQLVRQPRDAYGGAVHLLDFDSALLRARLRERELGVPPQPRERRAQLVRRVGEKALLVAVRFLD